MSLHRETPPVVLITGAAQGIGKAIAGRLLRDGWAVALADSDAEALAETAAGYAGQGPLLALRADVGVAAEVECIVAETVARFGGLQGIVNNAGIGRGGPVTELSLDDWQRVLAVNLTAAFLTAKHGAPHLRVRGGAIVNIASTRTLMSEANTEAYAASKGGLLALTHALAVSLGPAVRVNAVSPGWVETGPWQKAACRHAARHSAADRAQHPVGRVGVPEDIAGLVAYLLGPESGFITGQNFVVDGGMTVKMRYAE
jgi:NAD(P)-dependent dehydrogenase (short-subunit alcohol dehydrogenase family)